LVVVELVVVVVVVASPNEGRLRARAPLCATGLAGQPAKGAFNQFKQQGSKRASKQASKQA